MENKEILEYLSWYAKEQHKANKILSELYEKLKKETEQ